MEVGLLERLVVAVEKLAEINAQMLNAAPSVPQKAKQEEAPANKRVPAKKSPDKKEEVEKEAPAKEERVSTISRTALTAKCKKLMDAKGKEAVIELFAKYDAEKLKDIPSEKYPSVSEDIDNLLAKDE